MQHTRQSLKNTIARLGGDAYVSARIGVQVRTLEHYYLKRLFPAAWYGPLCALAEELGIDRPPISMFRMQELLPEPADAVRAA